MLHILKSAKEYFPTTSSGILIFAMFCIYLVVCFAILVFPVPKVAGSVPFKSVFLLHYVQVKIFLQHNKKYVIWNEKLDCKSLH